MKKLHQKKPAGLSRRISFPEDEQRIPWLPMLLDAYAIADTGVAVAVRNEEKRRKSRLACTKGCGNCCEQQKDIPLYPHELVGIYWYVSEKVEPLLRDALTSRLEAHASNSPCPFLVEESCSIHPLRPVGCRQFNVFTRPCARGEDPYFTRREDVLTPLPEYTDRSFAAVRAFYRLEQERNLVNAVKLIRSQIMNLQEYDWKKLVRIMTGAST